MIYSVSRFTNMYDPKNAAKIAGIPNFKITFLLALNPIMNNLKILFEKWTIPVNATAISTGKKIIITGVRIVPKPKPEKKVKIAAKKATKQMIIISIIRQ